MGESSNQRHSLSCVTIHNFATVTCAAIIHCNHHCFVIIITNLISTNWLIMKQKYIACNIVHWSDSA